MLTLEDCDCVERSDLAFINFSARVRGIGGKCVLMLLLALLLDRQRRNNADLSVDVLRISTCARCG